MGRRPFVYDPTERIKGYKRTYRNKNRARLAAEERSRYHAKRDVILKCRELAIAMILQDLPAAENVAP